MAHAESDLTSEREKPDTDEAVEEAACDVFETLLLSLISKIVHGRLYQDFGSMPS